MDKKTLKALSVSPYFRNLLEFPKDRCYYRIVAVVVVVVVGEAVVVDVENVHKRMNEFVL